MHHCPICQKFFTHEGNLQAHIKAVHYGEKRQRRTNKFKCEICFKSLCSKRSYDEHKNTHFNCRPFKCSMCPYAAGQGASQMTLRRHNLRQHVSKKDWHYRCPYCPCAFVEPTSYQSHIQHKHPGFSGTFGCDSCPYSTLSSKIFLQHMLKHTKGEIMPYYQSTSSSNFVQQPIRFRTPTPPPKFYPFDDQSNLTVADNVPDVGGQQIVTSSLTPPPPTFPIGQPSKKKNFAPPTPPTVNHNVNRFLVDDDLGEGYKGGGVGKQKISSEAASNLSRNFDDDGEDEETSTSSMTSSDDDDDDFDSDDSELSCDLENYKFAQNGISSTYFHPQNVKPEYPIPPDPRNQHNFTLSTIPEACFQVEIESSFSSCRDDAFDEQMPFFKTTLAKDLGNDILPDGQVDFDLD